MEKKLDISFVYEIYKELLTEKMRDIFEDYYYLDLSLREIGENRGISHQAVRDSIKKTEKQLLEYESKLRVMKFKKAVLDVKTMVEQNEAKENIIKKLESIGEN